MGNAPLAPLLNDATANLYNAWTNLAIDLKMQREHPEKLWKDEIYPALQAHHRYGSIGVVGEG